MTPHHPRYQFDRYLAAGGMGEVWQATDTLLDREVAVKVLRRELAADPVLRARFAAEARHAGALQHPHVASVLDYGELVDQGPTPLPFLVMELVEGQSLSALLASGAPLGPGVAADLIAQAAEGIEAAHSIGIVHRDVKPGNLLVTPEGRVKVTDFGVARVADAASLTMTGHLIGTPHYLSPEQAEGGTATTVSDVYSLGIVLYECLTGRKPFAAETPVATAVMHIREPLPAFPDPVPERLQTITRVATAKDPAARFRSAGAMAAALRDESPDTRSLLVPQPAVVADGSAEGPRRGALAVAGRALAGAVTVLLLAAGIWAVTGSGDDRVGGSPAEAASENDAELVRVRAQRFLGLDRDVAVRSLEELGLRPRVVQDRRPATGPEKAGTVAAIDPTGLVEKGSRVRLTLWAEAAPTVTPEAGDSSAPSGPSGGTGTADGGGPSSGGGGDTPPAGGAPAGPPGQGNGKGQGPGSSNAGGNGNGNGIGPGKGQGPGSNNGGGKGNGNGKGGNKGGSKGGGHGGGHGKPGKGGKG